MNRSTLSIAVAAMTVLVLPAAPQATPSQSETAVDSATDIRAEIREGTAPAVPGRIPFQGFLADDDATARSSIDLEFALYPDENGGTALWNETQTGVPVDAGAFVVQLGSVSPLNPADFDGQPLWLEVTVDGAPLPRTELLATAFAMRAGSAAQSDHALTADRAANVPEALADMSDVELESPSRGDVLSFDGERWKASSSGGPSLRGDDGDWVLEICGSGTLVSSPDYVDWVRVGEDVACPQARFQVEGDVAQDLAFMARSNFTGPWEQFAGKFLLDGTSGTGDRYGVRSDVRHNPSQDGRLAVGFDAQLQDFGATGGLVGVKADLQGWGNSTCHGFIANVQNTGSGSKYLYWGDMTAAGGFGTKWGLYLTDEDLNYLSGRLSVGGGSTVPDVALDVTGSGAAGGIDLNNTAGDPKLEFQIGGTTEFTVGVDDSDADKFKIGTTAVSTSTRLTIDGSGRVGIGTTAPGQKLQVTGNVYASGGDFYTATGNGVLNCGGGIMNANVNVIGDFISGTMAVNGDEDLYIDDDLHVKGEGYKIGGAWINPSDKRLKESIREFDMGLDQVMKIRPKWFRYTKESGLDNGKENVGVVAQEMLDVAPFMVAKVPFGQVVVEDETGRESVVEKGEDFYTFDSSALVYMLVNAVQDQQKQIDELRGEVESLRARN